MNKLILDGVEYGLSDSLVAKLKEEIAINDPARLNPGAFDRVRIGDTYYCIAMDGTITAWKEGYDNSATNLYCNANYCRDILMIKQRALHETLNRLLWRYSETHGGDSNPWPHGGHFYCNTEYEYKMEVELNDSHKVQGVVYFSSYDVAVAAIDEVVKPFMAAHPEFVW